MPPIDDWWLNAAWSVTPTIVLGLVFWFIIRMIVRSDRAERKAHQRYEAEERARLARESPDPPKPTTGANEDLG